MAVSARNQLIGTISALALGAVNDEVELTLAGGAKLVAIVTRRNQLALGLKKGKEAIADKLTGNVIKEIYVPKKIINIVMK